MNDADYIERRAVDQDGWEVIYRSLGMFDLAVCFQQLAACTRDRMPVNEFRGMGAVSVLAHLSNGRGVAIGTAPVQDWYAVASVITQVATAKERDAAARETLDAETDELTAMLQALKSIAAADGSPI